MGRLPRIDVPGVTYHVILRCNHDEWLLREESAKQALLQRILGSIERHQLSLFAYVIMDNHVHIALSRGTACSLAEAMGWVMTQTAKDQLRAIDRRGHFWRQRYRAIPVEENEYALALLCYLDRNPVRAGLVASAPEYAWSSCKAYALGMTVSALTLHPTYLGLGENTRSRQRAYQALLQDFSVGGDGRQPAFSRALALGDMAFCQRLGIPARSQRLDLAALLEGVRRISHPRARPQLVRQPAAWISSSRLPKNQ